MNPYKMHREILSRLLPKTGINIFDELIQEFEAHFNRAVTTIEQMKDKANKKKRGDIWEQFCRDYLLISGGFVQVWLLKDFNTQYPGYFPNQDNGIDLIGQTYTGWVAIQAKYRGKKKYLDWKQLSTFVGMCAQSKLPLESHLIMTNCMGISNKFNASGKDRSICRRTFQNTSREQWMKMVGTYQEHRLIEPTPMEIIQPNGTVTATVITPKKPETLEELRAARIAKFTS